MLHRMSSLEALQKFNADWESRLRKETPHRQATLVDGLKIVSPDGEDIELSDFELDILFIENIIKRSNGTFKLAPGKTIEDVCAALNLN